MARHEELSSAALVTEATVARRYYMDGLSKSDIAAELNLSRFKVARLIDHARESGLIRIELDYRGEIELDLSARLSTVFGLRHCVVIASPETDDMLLRTNLGRAGARLLTEVTEARDVVGLAWSRSLMAVRTALVRLAPCTVVQLTGALASPDVDESSIDLVRDVGRISRGPALFFYAPMIVPDAGTADVLRTQPDVARAVAQFPDLTKAMVGIGAWAPGLSTVADAVRDEERRDMYDLGVRAEMCGIQLDAEGLPVKTTLTDRLIGIDAGQLRRVPEVIAVAYGAAKAPAVRAALAGGFITSLVTHASLARMLLDGARP